AILFFQAEDGIRYRNVTGVQTCALPNSSKVDQGVINIEQYCLNYDWAALNSAMRSRVVSCPSITSDSNNGGETLRPDTAVRTGPNAWRGLSSSSSTNAVRNAGSIESKSHVSNSDRVCSAAVSTSAMFLGMPLSAAFSTSMVSVNKNASMSAASPSRCTRS